MGGKGSKAQAIFCRSFKRWKPDFLVSCELPGHQNQSNENWLFVQKSHHDSSGLNTMVTMFLHIPVITCVRSR